MLDESDVADTLGYPMGQNLFSSKYLTILGGARCTHGFLKN